MRNNAPALGRRQLLVSLIVRHASLAVACLVMTPLHGYAGAEPGAPATAESRAEQQFRKGLSLAEANKLEAAAAIFLRLTQEYPRLLEPYVQLAAVYQQQGNTQEAVGVLREALNVHTDVARLQEQLGDLYLELAAQAYSGALETDHATATARTKYAALEALGSARLED